MHIGLVGLGKMGDNMRERLRLKGVEVTGYDQNPTVSDVESLRDLVDAVPEPRLVWVMVPAGQVTDGVVNELSTLLSSGDLVIDGGNSRFTEDIKHAAVLADKGINYVDAGVSGGVWGLKNGYGLMVGGSKSHVDFAMPVFDALRPDGPREEGFVHVGDVGAGHYAKMVHNGIEYGMMQALAEGFTILKRKKELDLKIDQIAEIWRHGSVVRSWLLDLTARALKDDQELSDVAPYVADSGEGRWTVFEAVDLDTAAPVITLALMQRLRSRDTTAFADRLLALMREQFGGHEVKRGN